MSYRIQIAAGLVLACAAGALAAAILAGGADATGAGSAPVVREPFTPLPCTGNPDRRTTLQMEGCAEQRILRSDAQINALSRSIFSLLPDAASRRDFTMAQQTWVAFRRADCLSRSDVFRGGTLAGVVDAQCVAERSAQRVPQLRAFQSDLAHNN